MAYTLLWCVVAGKGEGGRRERREKGSGGARGVCEESAGQAGSMVCMCEGAEQVWKAFHISQPNLHSCPMSMNHMTIPALSPSNHTPAMPATHRKNMQPSGMLCPPKPKPKPKLSKLKTPPKNNLPVGKGERK